MIESLKRALGAGARPNQYLLELSWGDLDSERLNILCKAASLPEGKLSTVTAAYHGRKVVLRGEMEYPETYDITIYDDANLTFRKFFDRWLLAIDDPGRYKTKLTDGVAGGGGGFLKNLIDNVNDVIDTVNRNIDDIKDLPGRLKTTVSDWFYGYTGFGETSIGHMPFAAPLKIWLLDHNGNKIHGYELENAYPIALGQIDLGAEKQNEVVEFQVTFAYSDYKPLQ